MEPNTRSGRAAHWRRLVVEHSRSGLSLREFAARRGVSSNTLAYWKYTRRVDCDDPDTTLVPVRVIDDLGPARGELVLELADVRLRIGPGFDADELARVVRVLRQPC